MTELAIGAVSEPVVDLSWLMSALEHTRAQGQTEVVGYLEAIAEDVMFEMESSANRHKQA